MPIRRLLLGLIIFGVLAAGVASICAEIYQTVTAARAPRQGGRSHEADLWVRLGPTTLTTK